MMISNLRQLNALDNLAPKFVAYLRAQIVLRSQIVAVQILRETAMLQFGKTISARVL